MAEEEGIVVKLLNETAVVKTEKGSSCNKCRSKKDCAALDEKDMLVEVNNPVNARKGDRVVFSVETSRALKAGMIFYLGPLVMFLVGAVAGRSIAYRAFPIYDGDLIAAAAGLLSLLAAFTVIRVYGRMKKNDDLYKPTIIRIL